MRTFSLIAAAFGTAAVLAGCGGSNSGTDTTTPKHQFSASADVAYERSYTDCGSVSLADLAHRYHIKKDRDKIALAVAKYWAEQAHGGSDAVEAGKEGCYDGYKAAGR